jgi:hypothetical protein
MVLVLPLIAMAISLIDNAGEEYEFVVGKRVLGRVQGRL